MDKLLISLLVFMFRFFLWWMVVSLVLCGGVLWWIGWKHPRE